MMKTPENCLICGAAWHGGHQVPGEPMRPNMRVFYECGSSISYQQIGSKEENIIQVLVKNCQDKER